MMAKKENKSQNRSFDSAQDDNRDNKEKAGLTQQSSGMTGKVLGMTEGARKVNRKPLYIVGGIILLLVIGSWLIMGAKIGQKVYAEAAGHKIYKDEIDAVKTGSNNVSDHEAAIVLADKYLSEALGDERGVTVTDQDMIAEYGPDVVKQKDVPFAWQNKRNELFFVKLNQANQGVYGGKLLIANFSRNVAIDSPTLQEKKAQNPDIGNPAAIAADKKYAKDFITKLYNQLKNKQITWDQAIAAEHADSVVGEAGYPTQTHSRSFDGPLSDYATLSSASVADKIKALKPGELMKPIAVRAMSNLDTGETAEVSWLVVQMDAVKTGTGGDFQQYITTAKKQLGYKINV